MKVLLTGSTGRVGSRLLPRLIRAGHEVRVLLHATREPSTLSTEVERVTGDLLHAETLRPAVFGVDAIVHLAAFFRGPDAARIHAVNVDGTRNLAIAALVANPRVRFVFASTNLVYEDTAWPAREEDKLAPRAPYPTSKVAAEQALADLYRSEGLDTRVLRLAYVYGDADPHLAEAGPLFERWVWHPASRLHLVHHADVAQSVALMLNTPDIGGRTFNVADDAPITAYEVLALTGKSASLGDPRAPLEAPWRHLVNTARVRALGFQPEFPSAYVAARSNRM